MKAITRVQPVSGTTERPDWDEYFLRICEVVAQRADCTRRQVGAVIVRNHRIVSTGYNGAPAGQPGCLTDGACPRGRGESPITGDYDLCIAIHAEANALLYADYDKCQGATMYCTDKPCDGCKKLIAGAGIERIVTK
jgi:dCMP deaminase